jgi:TolB protein
MRAGAIGLAFAALQIAVPGAAQDQLPGVSLGLAYDAVSAPGLAVEPFMARFGGLMVSDSVETIVARDLGFSNRFSLVDSLPPSMAADRVDYGLWNRFGAIYLLRGRVEGTTDGFALILELHDVAYTRLANEGRFVLPLPTDPGFRMAVHRASDAVVDWVFGEPGMAASRITFSMMRDGSREIYIIDSDGENLVRITDHRDLAVSPAWSPDGTRIAYQAWPDGQRLLEADLASGTTRQLDPGREGNYITPAYSPDGEHLVFAVFGINNRSGLFTYDVRRDCCLTSLTEGRFYDLSPVYSPDGRWLLFNSNRLGPATPQVYMMPATGGSPEIVSPYQYGAGGYYTAPDWSPTGERIAFHGRVGRSGNFHILVAQVGENRRPDVLRQLTQEGNNEDPSWAPDGRHIVFVGERDWGTGLFVVDAATRALRPILRGVDVGEPDWSPTLSR